jgi:hypothetical protein
MNVVEPVRASRSYTQHLVGTVEGGSEADVTYCHTSLGPAGDAFVASFTEDHYRGFMQDWERRLNHYLRYGKPLAAPAG